jgi:hypothetical protein
VSATEPQSPGDHPWWQSRRVYLAELIPAVYGIVAWLWYSQFLFGKLPGPYWGLAAFSKSAPPLILLLIIFLPIAIVGMGLLRANQNRPGTSSLLYPLTASLLAGVLMLPACLPAVISPMSHIDTAEAGGQKIHLARIDALIDTNFALYSCDDLGLWCRQLYRSGDFSVSNAHLETDPASGALSIVVCEAYTSTPECESVHTYQP